MPGTFELVTLPQVTGLTGSLAAGGSLAASTTYYYKVFAVNRTSVSSCFVVSPRSASFSITTDVTNKKVDLSWNAIPGVIWGNASGYIILRNTSDSFPDDVAVCIMKIGAAHDWNNQTTNSFTDDGTCPMGQVPNFIGGLPVICCTGGTDANPITMWDIYQWDLSTGLGRIKPAIDTNFCDFEASGWKKNGMSWIIHAALLFGNSPTSGNVTTHFKNIHGGAFIFYGGIFSNNSANFTFGQTRNSGKDANLNTAPLILNHHFSRAYGTLQGVVKAYGLRIQQGGAFWGNYAYSGWNNPYAITFLMGLANGSEALDCDFCANGGNGYIFQGQSGAAVDAKRCRYAGIICHPTVNHVKPHISFLEGLGFRHGGGNTVVEPTVSYSDRDIIWRTIYHQTVIDGTFQSKNQTDNVPWLFLGYSLHIGGSLTFKNTVKGRIGNRAGVLVSGASVVIADKDGNTVYSGSTDANGAFDAGAITTRVLTPTNQVVGVWSIPARHEDTHVANGDLSRVYKTPHTMTISKAGFKNYVGQFVLSRKMDLEIALTPIGHPPAPWGA